MFINEEMVSIIFRLINFFILSGLVVYVFRKYLLISIKEKFAEKLAFLKDLENQHKNLVDQKGILDIEIKDQDKLFEVLKQKINLWDKACEKEFNERKQELAQIKKLHIKRLAIQNENVHQKELLKKVAPKVIKGTYDQLEKKFEDKNKSQTFLGDILSYMEKNS